jgi:hypothetical protein
MCLAIAGAAAAWAQVPELLRRSVVATLRGQCPTCAIEVGAVDLEVRGWRAAVRGLQLFTDARRPVRLDLRIDRAVLSLDPRSLVWGPPHLTGVDLSGVRAEVVQRVEPDAAWLPQPSQPGRALVSVFPAARVDRVLLRDGTLVFTDRIRDRTASVTFSNLRGYAGGWAPHPEPGVRTFRAIVEGTVAGSGAGRLVVQFDPYVPDPELQIELGLAGQELAELSSYSVPAEGLHLHGRIDRAAATLRYVRGGVHGDVVGRYHDLKVRFEPSITRGRIVTAVANLVATVELAPSNAERCVTDQRALIARRQRPSDPLVGFLWGSLRDACIELARRAHHGG